MGKPNALLSTLYSVVATYVEFFFGLGISILIARQLEPEQYGVYGYLMWIASLLQSLVSGGVTLGAIKFIAEARAPQSKKAQMKVDMSLIVSIHKYLQSLLFWKIIIFGLISYGLVFIAGRMQLTTIDSTMLYIIIIASIIKSYHMYYVSVLKGFEDFRALAILSALITPFNLILVLFCFFSKQSLMAYVLVYLAVSMMYLFISLFLVKRNFINSKNKPSKKQTVAHKNIKNKLVISKHIRTASWIAILSFIVLRQSELFFLNIYSTPDMMAFFNVGFTLASAAMTLVPGVYSAILMPMMARVNQVDNGQLENQLKLSIRYMFQLIIALLFPICFFAREIFIFLYGNQYVNAVFPFQVIIACIAFKTLSECTNAYLWSKNKQSVMLKLIIVGSIVTLLLDYYCIRRYHLSGALFAYSASTIFFVGINLALVMRKLSSKLEWVIYFKTILSGILAMLVVSPIGHYFPNIGGVISGCLLNVAIYILMLLLTFSLSVDDVAVLRKLNQRFLNYSFFERFLLFIQNRTFAHS